MSKIVAVIKRLFVQNWKMKLIALIFAFILWSFVIAEDNPYKTKTFRDFPLPILRRMSCGRKTLRRRSLWPSF